MIRTAVLATVAVCLTAAPASAQTDCAVEADRLRAHVTQAEESTFRWNTAWTIAFGVAAGGQLALALTETNPFGDFDQDYEETLYVGAVKATIGFASRVVLPLRTSVPPPDADRCVELTALRATITTLAKKERRLFWLTHLGGTALNAAGAGFLWYRRGFKVGATSFLISYPVGPLSAYTLPRKSWKLWRQESASWMVTVAVQPEQATLSLGGQF